MMKRIIPLLILVVMCISVAHADFDFIVTDSTEYNYGVLDLYDQSLLITGSGIYEVSAWDSSYVEVRGTSPLSDSGGIDGIWLDDQSNLLYSGGETDLLALYENATASLKGGRIDYLISRQTSIIGELYGVPIYNKHITLECQPVWSWLGTTSNKTGITGLWANGNEFSIEFIEDTDYDPVWTNINVVEIPEPATLALLGLGGLLIRRKK